MIINISYDQDPSTLPAGFTDGINSAVQLFENQFTDPVTININVGYGEVGGNPIPDGALASSNKQVVAYSYSTLVTALANDAKSSPDAIAAANLSAIDPVTVPSGISYD